MSDLVSIDQSQITYSSLKKMVNDSKHLLKGSDTQKYAELGTKYLHTLVAQVVHFQLKLDRKTMKTFYSSNYINTICEAVVGNQDHQLLLVAMGMLCLSKNQQAIEQILSQLQVLINNEVMNLCQKKKEEFILNFDMNKKLEQLHLSNEQNYLSTDAEQGALSQVSFTHFDPQENVPNANGVTFNLSISEVMKHGDQNEIIELIGQIQQIKQQIKDFMPGKNYNTIFTHLLQFKNKTFNHQQKPDQEGKMFKNTVILEFVNFLKDRSTVKFQACELGESKQKAKQNANRQILYQFFNAFPYVFKDFVHCMKAKNANIF